MGSIGKRIIIVLVVLALVIAGSVTLVRWMGRRGEAPRPVREVPGEARTVTLYFASRNADGLLTETREITSEGGLEREAEEVIRALLRGPREDDRISAIPRGTEINRVFWVEEEETLYLDFNRAIVANHPGGSAGEYYTIKQVLKTIGENFPQVVSVQFLVSGYPVDTIAGHYHVSKPLSVRDWL